MPLSPIQSRRFVLVLVAVTLGLSVLAAVLITRGWADADLQEQVSEQERERREAMPRLNE